MDVQGEHGFYQMYLGGKIRMSMQEIKLNATRHEVAPRGKTPDRRLYLPRYSLPDGTVDLSRSPLTSISTGLCNRRSWPNPCYSAYQPKPGYWSCVVRVNNREYSTDVTYARKDLAQESAATRAYMICRNFSVNDGMYPGQRLEAGAQGMPVAIGAGRKGGRAVHAGSSARESGGCAQIVDIPNRTSDDSDSSGEKRNSYGSYSESSNGSGGESPRSTDSGVAFGQKNTTLCRCRRGLCTIKHERCCMCLRDAGWTP